METWKYIGKQILTAREERGWSTEELARRFQTSGATMSRWQSAKQRIAFDDLERLARLLGKPMQFFLPGWYVDQEAISPEIARLTNRLSEIPEGELRQRVVNVLLGQIEILLELMPDWYVDSSAISPEIGHLIQRLNEMPASDTRQKLIEILTGQVDILLQSMAENR